MKSILKKISKDVFLRRTIGNRKSESTFISRKVDFFIFISHYNNEGGEKMKYYVITDIHGFYDEMIETLREKGYFSDKEPHKLIICGDLLDRGPDTDNLQSFVVNLLRSNDLIFIKGNHEDLIEELVCTVEAGVPITSVGAYHWHNGTINTAMQASKMSFEEIIVSPEKFVKRMKATPFLSQIIPSSVDFFETDNYVFVHGWIPVARSFEKNKPIKNWRKAEPADWKQARWANGIRMAKDGLIVKNKTVVCGHVYCGYARCEDHDSVNYQDYSPYYGDGIIALDSAVAVTRKLNCIIIED